MLILSEQVKIFRPGVYRHYKGSDYKALCVVRHSETLEELVLYCKLDDSGYWVRPLKMFLENIDINGEKIPRFEYLRANDESR